MKEEERYMERNEVESIFRAIKRVETHNWRDISETVKTGSNQYRKVTRNIEGYETNIKVGRVQVRNEVESVRGTDFASNSSTGFFMSLIEGDGSEVIGYHEGLPLFYFGLREKIVGRKK